METASSALMYLKTVDIDYISWLLWVLYPILITFLLPGFILLFLYMTSLGLFIYKHRVKLKAAYDHNLWDGALKTLGTLWWAQARIWHGKILCLCNVIIIKNQHLGTLGKPTGAAYIQ